MKYNQQIHRFSGRTHDVTVRIEDHATRTEVTVNRHLMFDRLHCATINWPGCGAQEVEASQAFLVQLSQAVEIAARLDALTPDGFAAFTDFALEVLVAGAVDA